MRLPWFSRSRIGPAQRVRRRRHDARLRVRQLERRRVLDAAVSVMVSPTMPAEGQNLTATATATGAGPFEFEWSLTDNGNQIASSASPTTSTDGQFVFNFALPDDTAQA